MSCLSNYASSGCGAQLARKQQQLTTPDRLLEALNPPPGAFDTALDFVLDDWDFNVYLI